MKFDWSKSRSYGHPQWALRISFGPGAGYKGGSTAWIAYRPGSITWLERHRNFKPGLFYRLTGLTVGWTKNGNKLPRCG